MGLWDYLSSLGRDIVEHPWYQPVRDLERDFIQNAADLQRAVLAPIKPIIQHSPFGTGQPIDDIARESGEALVDVAEFADPGDFSQRSVGEFLLDPKVKAAYELAQRQPTEDFPLGPPGSAATTLENVGGELLEETADPSNLLGAVGGLHRMAGKAVRPFEKVMAASGVATAIPAVPELISGLSEGDYGKTLRGGIGTLFGTMSGTGLIPGGAKPEISSDSDVSPIMDQFIESTTPEGKPYFTKQPGEIDYFNISEQKPFEVPSLERVEPIAEAPIPAETYDRIDKKFLAEREQPFESVQELIEPEIEIEHPKIEGPKIEEVQASFVDDRQSMLDNLKKKYGRDWLKNMSPDEKSVWDDINVKAYEETIAEDDVPTSTTPIVPPSQPPSTSTTSGKWQSDPSHHVLYDKKSGDKIELLPNGLFLARSGSGLQETFKTQREAMAHLSKDRPKEYNFRVVGPYKNLLRIQPFLDMVKTSPMFQKHMKEWDDALEPLRDIALDLFPNFAERIKSVTAPGAMTGRQQGRNKDFLGIYFPYSHTIHLDPILHALSLEKTHLWKLHSTGAPKTLQEIGRRYRAETFATLFHEMAHAIDEQAVHETLPQEMRFRAVQKALNQYRNGELRQHLNQMGDDYEWGERAESFAKIGGKTADIRGGSFEKRYGLTGEPFGSVSRERPERLGGGDTGGSKIGGNLPERITERNGIKVGEIWYRKSDGNQVTIKALLGPNKTLIDTATKQKRLDVPTVEYIRIDGNLSDNFEDNFLRDYSKNPPPKAIPPSKPPGLPTIEPIKAGEDLPPVEPIKPIEPPIEPTKPEPIKPDAIVPVKPPELPTAPNKPERYRPDRKYPGMVQRATLPVSNIIKKIDTLVHDVIKTYHKNWETAAGKFAYAAKVIGNHLNDGQKLAVVKSLEGQVINDPLVQKATTAVKALMDKVAIEATRAGVFVGYREKYWPHKYKQTGDWEFDRYASAFENLNKKQGNLEQHRISEREDYRRDWNVLTEYFVEATRRISEARTAGKNLEHVLPQEGRGGIKHPSDIAVYLERAIKRVFGRQKVGSSEKIASKARHLQALSDLGLVALYQPSQFAHTSSLAGIVRSARGMMDTIKNFDKHELEALRAGSLHANLTHEMSKAVAHGGNSFMYGANVVDKFMRVHSDHVGRLLIQDMIAEDKHSTSSAKVSGSARRMLKDLMGEIPDEISTEWYDEVGKTIADKANFRTGVMDMPLGATSSLGRMLTQYWSFAYQHTRFLVDEIIKTKDIKRMMKFIGVAAVLGEGIADLREAVKSVIPDGDDDLEERVEKLFSDKAFEKKKALDQWRAILYNKRIPWNHPTKRFVQNLTMVGGVGIVQNILEKLISPRFYEAFLGPVGSNVVDFGKAVQKDVGKGKIAETSEWATRQMPIYGNRLANYFNPPKKKGGKGSGGLQDVGPLY